MCKFGNPPLTRIKLSWINEIRNFLEDFSGEYPDSPETDIYEELGVSGDDFHEMMEKYAETYGVDMSNYLWYFHTDEEGSMGIGGLLFKPPYERVKRIPVTPNMLSKFIETKKWDIAYPEHEIPEKRTDLRINKAYLTILVLIFLAFIVRGCLR